MLFFSKLKQKIANHKFSRFQKRFLAVFSITCLSIFFYSHSVSAADSNLLMDYTVMPLLRAVLQFVALLLDMAETIFGWIIIPSNMKNVMDNPVVYATWRTVRDVFNVAFIMVLLFSAFATIFQASTNYNYKKVLLNLVLMALLVNFSYPIARFIVDASNMLMYGFLNNLGSSATLNPLFSNSGVSGIITAGLKEGTSQNDPFYLLSAIIFTFIFAITLLVIAVLLVIRTIAITIYIIFSPIGFVGQIAPGTGLASAGSKWWKDFIQQCFAGPTIVFFLFIATRMFVAINTPANIAGFRAIADATAKDSAAGTGLSGLITSASFFSLPIVILWYGIIMAQESGIAGAKAVVGAGKKAMKWGSGLAFADNTRKAYQARRAKAKEDSWANKLGGNLASQQDRLRGTMLGGTDARLRYQADQAAKVKKEAERNDVTNAEDLDLEQLATSSDKFESAAATMELAARGLATGAQLDNVRREFGDDSQVTRQLENKMKPYAADAVFTRNGVLDEAGLTRYMQSDNFNADKLGAAALGNQRLMDIGLRTGTINNENLEKSRKKSPAHERAIIASLESAANAADLQDPAAIEAARNAEVQGSDAWIAHDNQLRTARRVQTAHFAQTGRFHAGVNQASRAHLISRLNGDTAKRMHANTTGNAALMQEFADNLDPSKLKAIIMANEGAAQTALLDAARTNTSGPGSRGARNRHRADNDVDLQHMN